MSFYGFGEPINIAGMSGFQGQISYGGFSRVIGGYSGYSTFGYKPPSWLLDISLGQGWFGTGDRVWTVQELLTLGTGSPDSPEDAFPIEIDLRDKPSDIIELQPDPEEVVDLKEEMAQTVNNWIDYWNLKNAGVEVYMAGTEPPAATTETPSNQPVTIDQTTEGLIETEEGMGWFDDPENVYGWVDKTFFGGELPGGYVPGTELVGTGGEAPPPGGPPPGSVYSMADPNNGNGGGACGVPGPKPVWKCVCGTYKWVLPKRRRRKSLATKGDLKDLAALKGILGQGKSFEVWIATHS